jgi:hypothetical protein
MLCPRSPAKCSPRALWRTTSRGRLDQHCSERFADHAAAIAHHVCYLTTGHTAQPMHGVSWVGAAHDPPVPDVDPVLSALVAAMDTVPERHDGGPSIMLAVNGVIIGGQVISGRQWFHAEQLGRDAGGGSWTKLTRSFRDRLHASATLHVSD